VRHTGGTRPCETCSMDEYFIGSGALLTAGASASIIGATLHAQPERGLAAQVEAAVIDFESPRASELSRILIVAAGWTGARFRTEIVQRLVEQRDCSLADVIAALARAKGVDEVHLFAHWQPDEATLGALADRGVRLVLHPLEAIGQVALVSGQRLARWPSRVRAA
jgi:hypothetical protein